MFDLAVITYFVVTTFLEPYHWITIVDMDGKRIDKVLVAPIPEPGVES